MPLDPEAFAKKIIYLACNGEPWLADLEKIILAIKERDFELMTSPSDKIGGTVV